MTLIYCNTQIVMYSRQII